MIPEIQIFIYVKTQLITRYTMYNNTSKITPKMIKPKVETVNAVIAGKILYRKK